MALEPEFADWRLTAQRSTTGGLAQVESIPMLSHFGPVTAELIYRQIIFPLQGLQKTLGHILGPCGDDLSFPGTAE